MKKSIACIVMFASVLGFLSCEKSEPETVTSSVKTEQGQLFHSVTAQEYANATALEKRIIDQLDASVNALNIMAKNKDFANYEAIFAVSKDPNAKFSNSIIIARREKVSNANAREAAPDGKCHICGLSSAYSCVREVEKYMESHHTNEIDVHVKRTSDGCVDVTYH